MITLPQIAPDWTLTTLLPAHDLLKRQPYQRYLNWQRVKAYAESFDPRLFGALTVAELPTGEQSVVDGMHRVHAAVQHYQELPELQVPCFVIPVNDVEEEAILFETLNSKRMAVSRQDLFRSRLFRGDPIALGVRETVRDVGFEISMERGKEHPWNEITHPSGCEEIYRRSRSALKEALQFIADTWPEQREGSEDNSIRAVDQFLVEYSPSMAWDRGRVLAVLSHVRLKTLIRNARTGISGGSKSRSLAMAMEIARFYNENRPARTPALSASSRKEND